MGILGSSPRGWMGIWKEDLVESMKSRAGRFQLLAPSLSLYWFLDSISSFCLLVVLGMISLVFCYLVCGKNLKTKSLEKLNKDPKMIHNFFLFLIF